MIEFSQHNKYSERLSGLYLVLKNLVKYLILLIQGTKKDYTLFSEDKITDNITDSTIYLYARLGQQNSC